MLRKVDMLIFEHQKARYYGGVYDAVHVRNRAREVLSEEQYAEFERRIWANG